jgi:hypothetical protein
MVGDPVHVPGSAVQVEPIAGIPDTDGGVRFDGGGVRSGTEVPGYLAKTCVQ